MRKTVDLKKTIYELNKSNSEIIEIMRDLGFEDITKTGMLNTAGRLMTIPKGAALKGIDMGKIKEVFSQKGYEIID